MGQREASLRSGPASRLPADPADSGYWAEADLGATPLRRVRVMLLLGSAALLVLGVSWGLHFAVRADWTNLLVDLLQVLLGLLIIRLSGRGQERLASFLMLASLFVVICTVCLVMDLPSAAVARSTHHFLLPLGIGAYLLLRTEAAWLRHGVPLACFAAFLVLASSNIGFVTSYVLHDSVRATGTWVNNFASLAALYLLLYIMQSDMATRTRLESELVEGIASNQFALHFQPQVDRHAQIQGAEALIRWMHPVRGLTMPGQFMQVMERSGLIVPLGYWILETACEQLRRWAAQPATAGLNLAVNVSARQFGQGDFVPRVLGIVERSGIQPQRLKLELTESVVAKDVEDMIAKMALLKARGVGFSLDDFGTGYSSLSYLRRLPLDQLKIDQSFVSQALHDAHDAAIIRTVVALGESLGMAVIAEGVETQEQRAFLLANGCHNFQGYLFGRPMPVEDFEAMVLHRAVA